jgi:hypothetical protein
MLIEPQKQFLPPALLSVFTGALHYTLGPELAESGKSLVSEVVI